MTSAQCCVLTEEKLKKKYHIYTLIYITIKCPINFANIDWFVDFLFCHKIKYVNLGLLIWLVYFDIVDTLLQFIERNSDSVSRSMLLII